MKAARGVDSVLDSVRGPAHRDPGNARRQRLLELISGGTGLALALFMWGHMFFVGSILLGTRGFDWIAAGMERIYVAQPTVVIILLLFVVHAAAAARKIPAQLRERRRFSRLAAELRASSSDWSRESREILPPHVDSWLWIWQVRTGLIILVLGSFHLILMAMDIYTDLYGQRVGIEAVTSMARTAGGLVWIYGLLLLCVEFHAGAGLYRLAVKWGSGGRLTRRQLLLGEQLVFWFFVVLGLVVLAVLAGWLEPPLAFLLEGGA